MLVTAALACPLCLRSEPVEWNAALDSYDPFVGCACSSCRTRWRVYLEPQQALRFGLLDASSQ